jgi:purine nucleosidase
MKKIILDIDSVGDDILAMLYGLQYNDIDLIGITTVNGACGSIEQAVNVALYTATIADSNIPIYKGAKEALKKVEIGNCDPISFDDELRPIFGDRLDKFNELPKQVDKKIEKQSAVDFLIETCAKEEVILVTTGPLTNIAQAILKDKNFAASVKHAFVLGGCFKIPGNITPVTEYNIWQDPEAAKIVMNSGMKITLIPLDVCENNLYADSMLTRDVMFEMENKSNNKVTKYICDKFPIYIDIWREFFNLTGFPMDDVITLAIAIDETLAEYTEDVYIDVELEGEIARGQTVAYFGKQIMKNPNADNKNCRIVNKINGKRFIDSFVKEICSK